MSLLLSALDIILKYTVYNSHTFSCVCNKTISPIYAKDLIYILPIYIATYTTVLQITQQYILNSRGDKTPTCFTSFPTVNSQETNEHHFTIHVNGHVSLSIKS